MNDRLDDVWSTRDYPVLREVTRRFDVGAVEVEEHEVASHLDVDISIVRRACHALERRGFLQITESYEDEVTVLSVSGQAYLVTGLHPDGDDAVDQLVSLLREAADLTANQEDRGRLRRAASALSEASGTILTGVATAWVTGVLPH
ncbi:MAG: hypothetical protein ABIP57_00580 [Jatrophihabitantaceae bacterium]